MAVTDRQLAPTGARALTPPFTGYDNPDLQVSYGEGYETQARCLQSV